MSDFTIYTDGCSLGNPGPGGYGAYIIAGGQITELSEGFRLTTNNRMEILAAITALRTVPLNANVVLYSDSKLLTDAINQKWLISWEKKGWKKSDNKPVLNKDLWLELIPLLKTRNVKFVWVKGHAGNEFNERCDILSKTAADKAGNNIDRFYEDSKQDDNLFSIPAPEAKMDNSFSWKISNDINMVISKNQEPPIRLYQKNQSIELSEETLLKMLSIIKELNNEF